jgi:hypothetical protein
MLGGIHMAKPSSKKEKDAREEYELDVDRMINEGMAGGTTYSIHGRMQIEQARELPKENTPFPQETEG